MRLQLFVYLVLFVLLYGCTKNSDTKEQPSQASMSTVADSLMKITDSLRGKDYLHKNFYGIHKHGQDLAKHAHQDIPKKIRIRKRAAAIKGKKIEAHNKSIERRKKRIEKYFKNKEKQKESDK